VGTAPTSRHGIAAAAGRWRRARERGCAAVCPAAAPPQRRRHHLAHRLPYRLSEQSESTAAAASFAAALPGRPSPPRCPAGLARPASAAGHTPGPPCAGHAVAARPVTVTRFAAPRRARAAAAAQASGLHLSRARAAAGPVSGLCASRRTGRRRRRRRRWRRPGLRACYGAGATGSQPRHTSS